jgi:hypothetical protein
MKTYIDSAGSSHHIDENNIFGLAYIKPVMIIVNGLCVSFNGKDAATDAYEELLHTMMAKAQKEKDRLAVKANNERVEKLRELYG